jgi:hypothetical protein
MRRLTFGMVLVLVACALLDTNPVMAQTSDFPGVRVAYVQDSWNVSANFNKGDFLIVYFTQGADWRRGLFDIDEEFPGFAILYVGVNVTDPRGNTTMYLCKLGKLQTDGEEKILNFLDKNITRNEGGIDPSWYYRNATNSYYEIGGTVQFNGTYKFVIGNVFPAREDPPTSIDVRKITFTIGPYEVKFSGHAITDERNDSLVWDGYPYCDVYVEVIIYDPNNTLVNGASVRVCYNESLGIGVGDPVECFGLYHGTGGPLQYVGCVDCVAYPYYAIPELSSLLALPLFMMVTLLAVAVYSARIRKRGICGSAR